MWATKYAQDALLRSGVALHVFMAENCETHGFTYITSEPQAEKLTLYRGY